MSAEILSYSRSKGLFAGISLKGSVVSAEKSDMEDTYGKNVTAIAGARGQQHPRA